VQVVRRALVAAAAFYVLAFVACAAVRLTFGFELSWMESGMQAMTARLDAHQSIYAAPSPSYVPFLYPPLYYVVAHAVAVLLPATGPFAPMRLVSLLSTLATVALLGGVLARRRDVGVPLRWLLPALYLAFYGRFDFWLDASRVDSLLVLLLFAATALLVEGRRTSSALLAGLLGGLAILTKQPALPLFAAACLVVAVLAREPGRAAAAAGAAAATVPALLAVLGELRNPWLYFYTVDVPASHPLVPRSLGNGVAFVLLTMPLFLLAAARELRGRARRRDADADAGADAGAAGPAARTGFLWAILFAVSAVVLIALRLKEGATVNFFMPLVPIGTMVAASAAARLGPRREALLLAQFLVLLYDPIGAVPVMRDWSAAFGLVSALRAIPGDVFLPQFPGYLAMAGKRPVAHAVAVCDLTAIRPDLLDAIGAEVRGGSYAAAVSWPDAGARPPGCHVGVPRDCYRPGGPVPAGGDFFRRHYAPRMDGISLYAGASDPASDISSDIFVDPNGARRETEVVGHGCGRERARVRAAGGGR
jgi:hypothetical protein